MNDPLVVSQLSILKRQYFQLIEPHQLRWPTGALLKTADVQSWLFENLFDVDRIASPPSERYQLRVIKSLVSRLENLMDDPEEDDIDDNLMSALSSLMISNVPSEAEAAQQKTFVTYAYPRSSTDNVPADDWAVTLLEARSVLSAAGTTGLRTWEAALFLGSYLTSPIGLSKVQGKRIFEIGAGTGMLSILCAKYLEVAGIVATDGDEAVVDAIRTNLFLNRLDATGKVRTAALKWGRSIMDSTTFAEDYGMEVPDVVFGADVTYDKFVIPRLVLTLLGFFELNPALEVLISATIRNEETFETFLNSCSGSFCGDLCCATQSRKTFADFCGPERNAINFEQIDFSLVPEGLQEGPFYPTATTIQIWRLTKQHRD